MIAEKKQKVEIKCDGTAYFTLLELTELQNELKTLSNQNYKKLKNQILKFGFSFPFFVWQNKKKLYILDGHGKKKTLLRMQEEKIELPDKFPAVFVEAKDKREAKQKLLALNSQNQKMTEESLFEFMTKGDINFAELEELEFPTINMDLMEELFIESEHDHTDEELNNIPDIRETDIKAGDMFKLGNHVLLCGDATKEEDVKKLMREERADMVFTDPLYDMKIEEILLCFAICGKFADLQFWMGSDKQQIQLCHKHFDKFSHFFIFDFKVSVLISNKQCLYQHSVISKFGSNKTFNNLKDGFSTVLKIATDKTQKIHKIFRWSKKVELPLQFITHYSKQNDTILDIFGGSGSTLIACEETNRKCRMMEIYPSYCQIIINKYEELTGKKARKL